MNVHLHILESNLTAIVNNDTFIIPSCDYRYAAMLQAVAAGKDHASLLEILNHAEPSNRINIKDDKILIDDIEMPPSLQRQYLGLRKRRKSSAYLVNFWDSLKKNPNLDSIQMLYNFLEHNGHPIMADGSFIAYKVLNFDMTDMHTSTTKHKLNTIVRMDRDKVDSDPNQTCSYGLHVCSWEYLQYFAKGRTFEVLVKPKDVVCVPKDYEGTKMRVCAYKLYREVKDSRTDRTDMNKYMLAKVVKEIKGRKLL